jgi:O-antigen ligase
VLAFSLVGLVSLLLRRELVLGRAGMAFVSLLLAFAGWQLLSSLWSSGAGPAVQEAERTLVYVAAAGAALLCLTPARAAALVRGVGLGVAVVALGGLVQHLFPDGLRSYRLDEPIGYANASGLLAAMGLMLALGFTVDGSRWTRIVASAATVPLAATLYLSFSRGSMLALAVGLIVLLSCDRRRGRLLAGMSLLAAPVAVAVILAGREGALTGPATLEQMQADGRRAALELLPLIVAAALSAPVSDYLVARVRIGLRARRAVVAAMAVLLAGSVAAVLVREGGPVRLVERGIDAFTAKPPKGSYDLTRRLLNASGNERSAYWRVAADMVAREPLLGEGAGSYARWWTQERPSESGARNAHNLYLETLAELGPVGLILVSGLLAVPFGALRRARSVAHVPVAAAALAVFAAHAALDWDWQIPLLTLPAVWLGVALVLSARAVRPLGVGPIGRAAAGVGLAALVAVALVVHVGNGAATAGERAMIAGNAEDTLSHALRAERWMPWSSVPWELRGEAETVRGRLGSARASLRRAIELDPESWRAWYDLAVASDGAEHARALARAAALNPLGSEIEALRTGS